MHIGLALGLLSVFASQGAVADPNDAILQDALHTVYNQSSFVAPSTSTPMQSLFLQLNGSITFRGKVTPLTTNLYWYRFYAGSKEMVQFDMESYSNGSLIKRIVGDGESLYSYDLLLHQYSATLYGDNSNTVVRKDAEYYRPHFLDAVNLMATGNDAYLTKLLRQINTIVLRSPDFTSNYTSWMPGVASYHLLQGTPVSDTISSGVTYYPSASLDYYAYNATPKRTIVFEVASAPTVDTTGRTVNGLVNVYFNQLETVSQHSRLIQFVITPYPGLTLSSSLFAPYSGRDLQGWRVVVAASPVVH